MKKINIIKDSKDFEKILSNGKSIRNENYIIYYLDKEKEYYRFGLSVGKKISNKAVDRNKLKRRLKSIIDNNQNIYEKNKDYIIIMKGSCLNLEYQDLESSFTKLISKIK